MILSGESRRTVCSLMALMMMRRANSFGLIVTDETVAAESYVCGPGGFMDRFEKNGFPASFKVAAQTLVLKNGSMARFMAMRRPEDADRVIGLEPHMIVFDRRAILPTSVIAKIRQCDRTGFDLDALKSLNVEPRLV